MVCGLANAKAIETWECKDTIGSWQNVLVVASVDEGRESGKIKVAGVTHYTRFKIKGFTRRWDFDLSDDQTYNYTFTIEPNGLGRYFDFGSVKAGEKTGPSMVMECRERAN